MNSKKNLKRNLLICLLAGSAVMYTLPLHAATSVIGNNTLPTGENSLTHNHKFDRGNLEMTITQSGSNGIIKWDSFDVGGSATVNFRGDAGGYNVLNYVNGANASQIYGTINANNNGNIFIVNPAGVQIGNSAQINVGSLYVSNNEMNDADFNHFMNNADPNNIINYALQGKSTEAALMSLGNINANHVTFEGDGRIVIDSERIKDAAGDEKLNYQNINIKTSETNKNNIIIGYEAYDETITNGSVVGYANKNTDEAIATVTTENGTSQYTKANGYMWVEDVDQLQAINTNLGGNYALRNSIDATATDNGDKGFNPIGLGDSGKVIVNKVDNSDKYGFYGNFDGIDYNIFGLTIDRSDEANVGLFGVAHDANINNVTLVGGSITGGSVVGSVVGAALGNTYITNATNSASVTGNTDVGGIVGYSGHEIDNVGDSDKHEFVNTNAHFTNLINTGSVYSKGEQGTQASNAGGLIGYMFNGTLDGNSYNLGDVSGDGYNVGGLVGHAVNSTIGDSTNLVYNRLDVTGAYNVGGIVGNMEGTTVQNAENSGTVTAIGYDDGNYTFHTDYTGNGYSTGGSKTVDVNVANVGGIAGTSSSSTIIDVLNTGDVSSSKVKEQEQEYYAAGNVGGIVGSAVDTNITNATNRENEVRGAHNVGGVAGYFGSTKGDSTNKDTPHYTVTNGINDGGDIMATGARYEKDFVRETIRHDYNAATDSNNDGKYIVGNIGGVIGYMDGNNVYVTNSANRGTVHTLDITDQNDIKDASTAANVGGIVGKIDRSKTDDLKDEDGKIDVTKAAVSNSYNTGDVRGYTAIGGIVGMMYNGEIAGSYNLGNIMSTRISAGGTIPLNMGGIVGDTTENSSARAYLYDVYNKGQIGDETYTYKGRHVGGIAGRLSGTIEKAYNAGEIYNAAAVTGGIVGYMSAGKINNVFNTGNITVVHNDGADVGVQLGGLVGAANIGRGNTTISNAYNLGVIRAFEGQEHKATNGVGGVVGTVVSYKGISGESEGKLDIKNVYTTGDLYSENGGVGAVYGSALENVTTVGQNKEIIIDNVVYISRSNDAYDEASTQGEDRINYSNMNDDEAWRSFIANANNQASSSVDLDSTSGLWRVYDGTTPILNAYLPNSEKSFGDVDKYYKGHESGIDSIQYGTAYNPLLTIIDASKDLSFDWQDLGINNDAGLAVYGAGVTLDNFKATGGTGYYGGTIYADGNLKLDGNRNDISLGSASQIYGSSVTIETDGKVTIYGDVTATGNTANGATSDTSDVIDVKDKGNITITAGDVDVYGQLTSATEGEATNIAGIGKEYGTINNVGEIANEYDDIANMGDHYAHTTGASAVDGNITINAGTNADGENIGNGNVNLYFGNKEQGLITTGGDLTVTGTGDVYVDSDLEVGKNMTLTSTGKDGEVLLTLTNIGKVQANKFVDVIESAINGKDINKLTVNDIKEAVDKVYPELHFTEYQAELIIASLKQGSNKTDSINKLKDDISVAYMHDFMHSFEKPQPNTGDVGYKIALNAASGDAKLTVDMWEEDVDNTGKSGFDYTKYDTTFPGTSDEHTFKDELDNLNFIITNTTTNKIITDASKAVYVEVSTGEQLKAIQQAGDSALGYNYALMGDINASDVTDYEAIGGTTGFTGTFDGRGNRIIGLDTTKDDNGTNTNFMANAGIFSTIGEGGTVKNVNIYSGNFEGTNTAGAVAGMNSGRIENVTGFGNTVTVTNKNGNAGGIVGVNNGNKGNIITNEDGTITLEPAENERFATGIIDVESIGSVIAKGDNAVAGGLVGTNEGALGNSYSDSAVTSTFVNNQAGLGGVVGVNTEKGNVQYVDSLGVTNGGTTGSSNVGGVIGINKGNMYSGYNESIVSGNDYVGGIIGQNTGKYENDKWNGGTVENVVNATGVTGSSNYVGGLVGDNADEHSILTNLVNDSSAEILGVEYVGGIAGKNRGTITADRENNNLINRGSITGHKYVGGVAGLNVGTITNTNIDVELKVNNAVSGDHQYFGGIVGQNGDDKNEGTIENATNSNKIVAPNASYVGGIVGWNTQKGKLIGMGNSNEGEVIGGSYVGGVIGKNDAAIGSKNAAQVGIKNEGVVIATNGGAGGLIGENNAAITNTIMTNKGEVHGNNSNDGSGTGGLIGTNSGAISYSSMTNEVTGTVTGVYNVGGLIGVNKADITGGRDTVNDKDSGYYLNKIYNNGVINVGNYTDADKDGKYEFAASNGQNIGGLFGTNSGKVEAAYNTGAINASGSTNVGGIAGVNEQGGKLDQVFNTVMTGVDDKGNNVYGTITGGTNVGGLIGNNTGTLSNAYNTTEVSGNAASTGNLVGTNSGTVQYVYGYGVDSIDELIGEVTGTGSISHGHAIGAAENSWFQQDVYEDFTFGANGWKIYDGSTLPMLSVFLTKVTVVDQHLVNQYFSAKHYGELHQITADDIKALIAIGAISAPDGFGAFNNNNGLIQGVADDAMANSGNWLYSQQILGSNINGLFNPNNLGYDISLVYSPFENEDWPNNHWNYLFNDAPFDRNKDFRERKAEVNFVDGGMEV